MSARLAVAALGLAALAGPWLVPAFARGAEAAAASPRRMHEVRRGDTLGGLAKRYGVTVAALVAANRLPGPGTILKLGRRLLIPASVPVAATPRGITSATSTRTRAMAAIRPAPHGAPRPPAVILLEVPDLDDVSLAFQWPADGPVTSPFGQRRSGWHRGIDIKVERGTPVQAAAAGVVIASEFEARYGRFVKVEHEGGFVTIYAHNDENLVGIGDRVAAGETIATVGRTGRATTYHVHFEIRRDGQNYNPLYLLPLPPRIARVEETDENPPDDE